MTNPNCECECKLVLSIKHSLSSNNTVKKKLIFVSNGGVSSDVYINQGGIA